MTWVLTVLLLVQPLLAGEPVDQYDPHYYGVFKSDNSGTLRRVSGNSVSTGDTGVFRFDSNGNPLNGSSTNTFRFHSQNTTSNNNSTFRFGSSDTTSNSNTFRFGANDGDSSTGYEFSECPEGEQCIFGEPVPQSDGSELDFGSSNGLFEPTGGTPDFLTRPLDLGCDSINDTRDGGIFGPIPCTNYPGVLGPVPEYGRASR